MIIRDLYNDAVQNDEESLLLLLDFLIFEKQVLAMEDDSSKLDHYFKSNNKERMNQLLSDYRRKEF